MGSNGGSGKPFWFRCSACRKNGAHDATLTGRKKPAPHGTASGRSSDTYREYKCACGHVGWSRHTDLEQKEKANERTKS